MQVDVDRVESALTRFEGEEPEAIGGTSDGALGPCFACAEFDEAIAAADRDREIHRGTFLKLSK
jgi:hypothetical protein